MNHEDDEPPPPTLGELKLEIDAIRRDMAVFEGNLDITIRGKHQLVKFYYRIVERIRRLEQAAGLPSPEGDDPLTAEQAGEDDT